MEWQDKGSAYLSSGKIEVGRWVAWASILKEKVDFKHGHGKKLATFLEAVEFDRQMYDAIKVGTEGRVYKIVRRVHLPLQYEFAGIKVVLDSLISLWFEAWRQFHLEYGPRPRERERE